jgi:hypothetical protein
MTTKRQWLSAGVILALGLLQAWDSNTLEAGNTIALMLAAAVAVPAAAALITSRADVRWTAVAVTAGLVVGARITSPIALPESGLLILIAAFTLCVAPAILDAAKRRRQSA